MKVAGLRARSSGVTVLLRKTELPLYMIHRKERAWSAEIGGRLSLSSMSETSWSTTRTVSAIHVIRWAASGMATPFYIGTLHRCRVVWEGRCVHKPAQAVPALLAGDERAAGG
jgi:hypothetical protein